MKEIFGSQTKTSILVYLALRGGSAGRKLARELSLAPSQIFKALQQLQKQKIILKTEVNETSFYRINDQYAFHDELRALIHKEAVLHPKKYRFLPNLPLERQINPFSVYEFVKIRNQGKKTQAPRHKFSDVLREKYG